MALDLQSKKLLWKYTPTDRQFPFYSSAAIADGKVVLGGRDKMVHALEDQCRDGPEFDAAW